MFHRVKTSAEIDEVARLARIIWVEHYSPMLGHEQVEYMLSGFHSRDAISSQISDEHYRYFLIRPDDDNVGYIGLTISNEELFLSKLYILSSERGSGLGRQAMAFITSQAREFDAPKISLTVNKHNTETIAAYYKLGFEKTGDICFDIGSGHTMDDLQMELIVR